MRRRESKPFRGIRPINEIVPILYGERDFDAFDDFGDFVESISYGSSKTCQVRGSNQCQDRQGPPACEAGRPA
jgi:hypothetical protein